MDSGKVKFFLGEVLRNFTRNAGMQATAIGTVAMTIVLLGAFLFVHQALAGLGNNLLNQIEISVYFKNDVSSSQEDALRSALEHDPRIASTQFVPKKEGLAQLSAETHGAIDTSSLLTENPLPDKLRVWVHDPQGVAAMASELQTRPGVDKVLYPQDVVARLLTLGAVLRRIGIGVIALFLVVAGIIISNTIRLTVFARRREISIMQLVGATNMYIRAPFICEGLLDGVLGSFLAVLILAGARYALWPKLLLALPWIQLSNAPINGPVLVAQLLAAGGAIGIIASWISVGRHLRT
ncbi:MAG TPA: permease-like cell division protein FtsX [Alphaproteobacteria bacterium]|nr:permease-like cell division protein FtsX [Alphaproteobacteria bacterium]